MLNLKELKKAVEQVAQEKGVNAQRIFEALEASLASAYKKEYCEKGAIVKAKFDQKTGTLEFWKEKTVVDETTVRMAEEGEEEEDGKEQEERGSEEPPRDRKGHVVSSGFPAPLKRAGARYEPENTSMRSAILSNCLTRKPAVWRVFW